MDKILNYQISLFGNFIDINADDEAAKSLLNLFDDFTAGYTLLTTADFKTGQLLNTKRLQLRSKTHNLLITFMPERIDLNYQYEPFIKDEVLTIDEVFKELSTLLVKFNSHFSELLGNRLATSCNILSPKYQTDKMNEIITRFSNKSIFFSENDYISEWSLRFNSNTEYTINNASERINRLVTLSVPQNPEYKDQILMIIDINTIPFNQKNRFTFNNLIQFADEGKKIMDNYLKKFENETK